MSKPFNINDIAGIAARVNGASSPAATQTVQTGESSRLQAAVNDLAETNRKLTPWARFNLRMQESGLARGVASNTARHRWAKVEELAREQIDAEVELIRIEAKGRWSIRFAALSEQLMATHSVALTSLMASYQAGLNRMSEDVHAMYQAVFNLKLNGRISEAEFDSRIAGVARAAKALQDNLEESFQTRISAIRDAFGRA